jgi:hypothetical protein
MNHIHHSQLARRVAGLSRHVAGALASLAALLASMTMGPAAFASPQSKAAAAAAKVPSLAAYMPPPPPGTTHPSLPLRLPPPPPGIMKHPPLPGPARVHAAVAGGLPVWQITLAAVGVAVIAAAVVLLGRALASRQHAAARAT